MKHPLKPALAVVLACILGAGVELLVTLPPDVHEAWDSMTYWTVGYPLILAGCFFLGWAAPKRAWLWGLLVLWSQFLTMALRKGEGASFLVVGLLFMGALSLPTILASLFGGMLGRRKASAEPA